MIQENCWKVYVYGKQTLGRGGKEDTVFSERSARGEKRGRMMCGTRTIHINSDEAHSRHDGVG